MEMDKTVISKYLIRLALLRVVAGVDTVVDSVLNVSTVSVIVDSVGPSVVVG